jgi:hypothetical protein
LHIVRGHSPHASIFDYFPLFNYATIIQCEVWRALHQVT